MRGSFSMRRFCQMDQTRREGEVKVRQKKRIAIWFAVVFMLSGLLGQGYFYAQAVGLEGDADMKYEAETGDVQEKEQEAGGSETDSGYEMENSSGRDSGYEMESDSGTDNSSDMASNYETGGVCERDGDYETRNEFEETKVSESIQTEVSQTETIETGNAVLTVQNGEVELIAQRKDGSVFPAGYRVWLLSAEDAAMDNAEEEERIRQTFRNAWKKELKNRYLEAHDQKTPETETEGLEEAVLESMTDFLPYYIKIVDERGEEAREEIAVTLIIKDNVLIQKYREPDTACYLGIHQTEQPLEVSEQSCVSRELSEEPVKISGSLSKSGWISIALVDRSWIYDDREPVSEESENEEQSERESAGEEQTESGQTEENCEDEKEKQLQPELGVQLFRAARSVSRGTKLPTGAYQAVSSGMKASAEYNGIIFRSGISSLELFGTASSNLVTGDTGKALYWQPIGTGQKGTCGAVYRKVLYNNANHQWYDLRITLQNYTDSVEASDGKSYTCYPFMGFFKSRVGFSFYRAGMFVAKCELINSTSQKKESVKFRLNIEDIDDYQVCGFKLGNGSIDQRYCMSDNIVYYTANATIAGVGGFEQLVGDDILIEPGDHRGDVIYDASGSEFYLAVGYGDNDQYSWKDTIKPRYDSAVAGTLTGGYGALNILAQSTILPVDVPNPAKSVSTDGKTWGNANTLPSAEGEYWYRVEQFVPEENETNYYDKFVMTDVLPAGVDFVGKMSVTRVENNGNADSWFSVTTDNDTVTATALPDTLKNAGFYGYHFAFCFKVKMDLSEISPGISGNEMGYTVKNTAAVTAKHKTDKEETVKKTAEVITKFSIARPETPNPLKSLNGDQKITEWTMADREEEITFTIWQEIPAGRKELSPKRITMTDRLEDCLEYLGYSASQTADFQNYTDNTSSFHEEGEGQTLMFSGILSQGTEKVIQRMDIRCRIRQGYDLSAYLKNGFYEIGNQAAVTLGYDYGDPKEIERNTNSVLVKVEAPPPMAVLELTKEIDAADVVFAHGNPIFIFKAEGTDTKGNPHTYYQSVEFTKENGGDGQRKRLTAEVSVAAGTYTVTEERTLRYRLAEIYSVTGGAVSGNSVHFDVTKTDRAGAVFYNKKITEEALSHTALVKNHIGEP